MTGISIGRRKSSIGSIVFFEDEPSVLSSSGLTVVHHQHVSYDTADLNVSDEVEQEQLLSVIGPDPMASPDHVREDGGVENTSD